MSIFSRSCISGTTVLVIDPKSNISLHASGNGQWIKRPTSSNDSHVIHRVVN